MTIGEVPAKVLGRVIIQRIREGVDVQSRREQAGFRKGRSTVEQIFILRKIIKQVLEWNASLYLCFTDFEKAFTSVHGETLWKITSSYGLPPKLVAMVQAM